MDEQVEDLDPLFGTSACHNQTKQRHKQGGFEGVYRLDNCCNGLSDLSS